MEYKYYKEVTGEIAEEISEYQKNNGGKSDDIDK